MEIGILRRDGRTDAFFDGAAADRLVIKRCEPCDRWYPPDASSCPECGTEELTWADASGEAALISWATAHSKPREDGSIPPPALLALVELAEGPWIHSRLEGVTADALSEGLRLSIHFEHPHEGESYPVFRAST